jgi:hypothetical protein
VDPALIPLVTAMACLLSVFGHGPVADHERVKLIGGLGAAVLFAAAGGVGAWASVLIPPSRLAVFAGLFAALGVSFNLALHPTDRASAATTADILQGLAFCGLAVACWRRWVGAGVRADAVLVTLPFVAHFWLRPVVPDFAGAQYLFADPAGERSLFPLFPWLSMAALGARAVGVSTAESGAAAVLFAAATVLAWWSAPGMDGPVKFPMNPSYAMLSCATIGAAFTVARGLKRLRMPASAAAWLGRNWLVWFYLHFAIVSVLRRSGIDSAPLVWALLAAGSLGATWLLAKAALPFSKVFQSLVAWVVPLVLIVVAGVWPLLAPGAVSGLAGCAGLIFAAYHGTLAYAVVNFSSTGMLPIRSSRPDRPGTREPVGNSPDRSLFRLALILALLVLPELVGLLEGRIFGRARPTAGEQSSLPSYPEPATSVLPPDGPETPKEPGSPRARTKFDPGRNPGP